VNIIESAQDAPDTNHKPPSSKLPSSADVRSQNAAKCEQWVALHRRRVSHDSRACCRQDSSLRSEPILQLQRKFLRRLSSRAGVPIHGAFQSCRTLMHSSSYSKLHILRTAAVFAMSRSSRLRREETINGRDYYGCVCPLGIDSDGKTSRADCPVTPLRIVPGWPNRDTVLRSGGSRGGKNGECDYRLSPGCRIENGTRF
jgi:hypothetical protein